MESKGHFKKGTIEKKSHDEVPWLEAIPVAVSRKSVAEWLHHLCASILSPSLTSHRSSKLYILWWVSIWEILGETERES